MPTKKRRKVIIPDNLPALTDPDDFCPSVFTGNGLAKRDPETYGKVVQDLAEGKALTRIAREHKVAPETVSAISKREHKTVQSVQELTQGLTSYASQACLEMIIRKLDQDQIPAGVLPICFGILRDKEKADLGEATTITEQRKVVSIDEVQKELEAMKAESIPAEVTDITPEQE